MRILNMYVTNFSSYTNLDFQFFPAKGLTLIQGATGSGKSTFCDAAPWILYGKTAKGGAVDEVLPWGEDKSTYGYIVVDTGPYFVQVVRSRSKKGYLDFYFTKEDRSSMGISSPIRGKDAADTQKLLNQELGVDFDAYLSGAYFHEFSQTAGFFTASAKARRTTCEQIIDLNLAKKLQGAASELRKQLTKDYQTKELKLNSLNNNLSLTKRNLIDANKSKARWGIETAQKYADLIAKSQTFMQDKKSTITLLKSKSEQFEQDRQNKIQEIHNKIEILAKSTQCPVCGANKKSFDKDLKTAFNLENPYLPQIAKEKERVDNYLEQAEAQQKEQNPYDETISHQREIKEKLEQQISELIVEVEQLRLQVSDQDQLDDILSKFRSELAKQTVDFLETHTNDLLRRHFDNEIKVGFVMEDGDKLNVTITKNGNECSFSQLSKGQRQLLKLCFSLAVMKQVSNHQGTSFNCIFLDEALDGLDDEFKSKAYYLLKELELTYESIFVVEHSEALKALFDTKYSVSVKNGVSILNEEST